MVFFKKQFERIKLLNDATDGLIIAFLISLMVLLVTSSALIVKTMQEKKNSSTKYENGKPLKIGSFDPKITKQWRVRVGYNNRTNTLSLKNIEEVETGLPDYRQAKASPFFFQLVDKSGKELFGKKVIINEYYHYDANNSASGGISRIEDIESEFYIPYFENGVKIHIYKNNTEILEIPIEIKSSTLVKQIYAEGQNEVTCGPETVVFISDNYKSMDEYHTMVQTIIDTFKKTPPYDKNFNTYFDFKIVDNSEALGCAASMEKCIAFKGARIRQIGKSAYPQASYYIVIVKNSDASSGVGGVTNGPAGDMSVSADVPRFVTHEFLGHAFGALYDRYVYPKEMWGQFYKFLKETNLKSNCSDNTSGEAFWKNARSPQGTNAYAGCSVGNWYGPEPYNSCTSTMRACGATGFDKVEQYWIEKNILSDYRACPNNSQQNQNSTCGGWHQACCAGQKCTFEVTACTQGNTCELCGFKNEQCCKAQNSRGITCVNDMSCSSNHCCDKGEKWDGSKCVAQNASQSNNTNNNQNTSKGPITSSTNICPGNAETIEAAKKLVFEKINEKRAENKLIAYVWDDNLSKAAKFHSQDMADHSMLSHTSSDGTRMGPRVQREAGLGTNIAVAEIIARTFVVNTVDTTINGWMSSDAHRSAILGGYRKAGVGIVCGKDSVGNWTVDFSSQ